MLAYCRVRCEISGTATTEASEVSFILLLKDTSLASVVAVPEISHLTRQYASNRFRYPEGLLILSFIYANVTILMSLGVIYLEHRLQQDKRDE